MLGGPGGDFLRGETGDDILGSGQGNDFCDGGSGRDEPTSCEQQQGFPR